MIEDAIERAYKTLDERNWDKIFVGLDLHGTVMDSNYKDANGSLLKVALEPLQKISNLPEVSIILFSCCYEKDYETYLKLFHDNGINVDYFNENPAVENTRAGCFDKKFYYSILLDDKAGFNPDKDWNVVRKSFLFYRCFSKRVSELYSAK